MFKQLSCYLFAFFLRSPCLPVPFSLASSLILYKRSFHLIQHWESSDDENYRKVHEKRERSNTCALLFSLSTRTQRTRSKQHLSALGGLVGASSYTRQGHCEEDEGGEITRAFIGVGWEIRGLVLLTQLPTSPWPTQLGLLIHWCSSHRLNGADGDTHSSSSQTLRGRER